MKTNKKSSITSSTTTTKYHLYILFFIVFLIDVYIGFTSERTLKCLEKSDNEKRVKIISSLVFHHIVSVFAHYGWLLPSKPLLILFMGSALFTLVNWKNTGGYCQITKYTNKLCDDDEDYFHEILWKIGVKERGLHEPVLILFFLFGVIHYFSL